MEMHGSLFAGLLQVHLININLCVKSLGLATLIILKHLCHPPLPYTEETSASSSVATLNQSHVNCGTAIHDTRQ
jgi:hypothetical protein